MAYSSQQTSGNGQSSIYIRCIGRHDCLVHFLAIVADPSGQAGNPEGVNRYKIRVEERLEQVMMVDYNTEEPRLRSAGGLLVSDVKMKLNHCVKPEYKYVISRDSIGCTEFQNEQMPINWSWNLKDVNAQAPSGPVVLMDFFTGDLVGEVTGISNSSAVVVKIADNGIAANENKKMVLTMALVKAYYGAFNYHEYLAPYGIPSMMPCGSPCFPTLSILEGISEVSLRFSCKSKVKCQDFLDVLDATSREILLVVAMTSSQAKEILFRDLYGITQFIAVQEADQLYTLRDDLMTAFGTICTATGVSNDVGNYEPPLQLIAETLTPAEQCQKTVWQMEMTQNGVNHSVAAITHYKETDLISLSMLKSLEVTKKAFVLGQTMILGSLNLQVLSEPIVPVVADYAYRRY